LFHFHLILEKHMTSPEFPAIPLLIDGEWRAGSSYEWRDVINPATEQTIASLAVATDADLDDALRAAGRAFDKWRDVAPFDRSKILRSAAALVRERAPDIASQLSAEQGKPVPQAHMEMLTCADIFDWNAEESLRAYGRLIAPRQRGVVQKVVLEPIGPVAAFSPWNFPGSQAARKIGAALAAGCSLILKPPEEAPRAAIGLARALMDAGLPAGVLNLVFGEPSHISERLIESPIIRKISFTGSVPVGKHLAGLAARQMKPATMELGGHSPVLVFDDVDPASIATKLAANKFRNAGQICISPTRVMLHDSIYEPFMESFAEAARAIKVGDGAESSTEMGPLASRRRLEAVSSLVDEAVTKGATAVTGGRRIGNRGFFYEPTVLADIPDDARIMHEEPFGPIVLMSRFYDLEEGVSKANATRFGLASYAFTSNATISDYLERHLDSGMVSINGGVLGLTETPFGGIKESGYGREGGPEGLSPYLVPKFIAHAPL
jgi:succinate-semialdehyde dehydrogenase/glutarate-semialdehyde dehydrogenase